MITLLRVLFWACILAALVCLDAGHGSKAQTPVKPCAQVQGGGCSEIIQPQATSTALESSHVFKASGPSTAVDFQVNNTSGSELWVMLIDGTVAPTGAGAAIAGCATAATTRPCVAKWYQIGANSTLGVSWAPGPFLWLLTGQVLLCSSTGPFTITYSANCTFSGEAM
jgi:hypothetical protein